MQANSATICRQHCASRQSLSHEINRGIMKCNSRLASARLAPQPDVIITQHFTTTHPLGGCVLLSDIPRGPGKQPPVCTGRVAFPSHQVPPTNREHRRKLLCSIGPGRSYGWEYLLRFIPKVSGVTSIVVCTSNQVMVVCLRPHTNDTASLYWGCQYTIPGRGRCVQRPTKSVMTRFGTTRD